MFENEEYSKEDYTDFMVKLYRGAIVPINNPKFNNGRVEIEIYSNKFEEIGAYKIKIEGKEYNIESQNILSKIEKHIKDNLDCLINWSINQNRTNLDENGYDGGVARTIKIKYGQLTILVNGQVRDIGNLCDKFIDEILTLIISESDLKD